MEINISGVKDMVKGQCTDSVHLQTSDKHDPGWTCPQKVV